MTLEARLVAFATANGADIKLLNNRIGDLSSLPTTAKNSLVAALVELYGLMGEAGAVIDDNAGNGATSVTWSADKIFDMIAAAKAEVKNDLWGGATAAYDTFVELEALMKADDTIATALAQKVGEKVSFAEVQTLTTAQRLQACENMGLGNPDVDLVAAYNAAKA